MAPAPVEPTVPQVQTRPTDRPAVATTSQFRIYSPEAAALEETSLLFFAASWSSRSNALEQFLRDAYSQERLRMTTFKVDFDAANDLKTRYGVSSQDTFVHIDQRGKALEIINNPTESRLLELLTGEASVGQSSATVTTTKQAGQYSEFRADVIGNGQVAVLFFHAGWCPDCKKNNAFLTDYYGTTPPTVSTYKVDYDTAAALKQQYEIVRQDTFVLIDGTGQVIRQIASPTNAQLQTFLAN
jgi:thiol-disulfide isomerase/thioredoxin